MLCIGFGLKAQDHPKSYNRISISFRNVNFTGANGYIGGGFDYAHGFGVTQKFPMYVEVGASIAYVGKDYGSGWDYGYATINVPVNYVYRLALSDKINLMPYLGLNFKGNIIGSNDMSSNTQTWYTDYDFKRFQLGWQIGVGLEIKKFYVGLNFGTDFVQISPHLNTNTLNVSLGPKI